jgi:hypothetical protein
VLVSKAQKENIILLKMWSLEKDQCLLEMHQKFVQLLHLEQSWFFWLVAFVERELFALKFFPLDFCLSQVIIFFFSFCLFLFLLQSNDYKIVERPPFGDEYLSRMFAR